MRDIIYNILCKYYSRMYGYDMCDAMTEHIAVRLVDRRFTQRSEVREYIWMNTSGGGVALSASGEIQRAFYHYLEDDMKEAA